ncbi:MAG TPA: flavoprotein [Arachnia sp.]|nr:flavoprotein [Arachnia sp.]
MTESQLRDLIREVIAGLMPQRVAPRAASSTGLVLFTGALLGFEEACASLTRLNPQMSLDWIQTDSARRVLDQDTIAGIGMTPADKSLVASHDLLIVPTLTVNMVAKVVHGVGDCLASNVIAEFIMSGKPVVAVTNAACPDSEGKRSWFPHMPSGYQAMLRKNLATLRSFGVQLSDASRLDRAVLRQAGGPAVAPPSEAPAERVVTEATVAARSDGAIIRLHPRAIVTDLAREAAAKRHITLQEGS